MSATSTIADELRAGGCSVLTAADPGYDDARELFNAMIDSRPAAIVRCSGPQDVVTALGICRAAGVEIAVRSGGHSVRGASTCDGVVIDVRPMNSVEVDPTRRVARVGGGATWGELDAATQRHGLATTGGRDSTTGVAGLTLGGGSGWLERQHGLACDNLVGVELVTAAGEVIRADADNHPELFWALHGGGGSFGIATALEFRLHPVGPQIHGGLMLWPAPRGRAVAGLARDVMDRAPDELSLAIVYLHAPPEDFVPPELHGRLVCAVALFHPDSVAGASFADAFRELEPVTDLVGPMPYAELQSMLDDPPGLRNWWTADYLAALPDDALDEFVRQSERMPASASQSVLFAWGGAVARVPADATPLAKRDAMWVHHPFAMWESAADDELVIGWARESAAALRPFSTGGTYLNFIGDEGSSRVEAAFGRENLERLRAVKAELDPEGVLPGFE